jgi:hypothetical protein
LKIQFLILDKIKIQITIRISAITVLITDEMNQLKSPYPEIDIGPRNVTIIPPPMIINPHIANKNPKRPGFKVKPPS